MSELLLTGGTGCIGAATVAALLETGAFERVLLVSRSSEPRRLALWGVDEDPRVEFLAGDVGDAEAMRALMLERAPTHVVHLAALQSPDCAADPARGMRVNVGGTMALLQAAEELGERCARFVFASSAAVYGPRSLYASETVREDARLAPPNLYGIWKLAGEELCRLFHERTGVPTICLRLNTTYGKGRDQGMTAAVTHAMRHVVRGEPFRMPYRGRENYHYVADVGAQFAAAATRPYQGFGSFNLRGETIEVVDFLARIERVGRELGLAPDLGLVDAPSENLFVSDLDERAIQGALGEIPRTSLDEGIRASLEQFRAAP